MIDPVKNFAKVEVSIGYNAAATSIVLVSAEGAKLPQPSTDGEFNLTWWDSTNYGDPADDPNVEIVRCTARSTDTLTVTRAQEGTSATTKNTGGATYKMVLALTEKMKTDMTEKNIISITAGETIDASSAPQAVYVKTSDSKIYKADTDADESTFNFVGFVGGGQSSSTNSTTVVTTSGVLGGFSSLTTGNFHYLSATAGSTGTSPISTQGVMVGFAISSTEMLIYSGTTRTANWSSSVGSGTTPVTNTVTIGFRPRLIVGRSDTTGSGGDSNGFFIVDGDSGSISSLWQDGSITTLNASTTYCSRNTQDPDDNPDNKINNITSTGFDCVFTRGDFSGTSGTMSGVAIA